MKRFFENTLISRAFSNALRVVALLCVLLGVSTSAMAAEAGMWGDNVIGITINGNTIYMGNNYKSHDLGTVTSAPSITGGEVRLWKNGNGNLCYDDVKLNIGGTDYSRNGNPRVDGNNYYFTITVNKTLPAQTSTINIYAKAKGNENGTSGCNNSWQTSTFTIKYTIAEPKYSLGGYVNKADVGAYDATYNLAKQNDGTYKGTFSFTQNHEGAQWLWVIDNTGAKWGVSSDTELRSGNSITLTKNTSGGKVKAILNTNTNATFIFNPSNGNFTFTADGGSTPDIDPEGCTTVYLNDAGPYWNVDGAELYVYYFNNTKNTNAWKKLTAASSCDMIFYTSIPNDVEGYIFVRLNNVVGTPTWDRTWNQTGDLTLNASKTEFKLSHANGSGALQAKTCNEEAEDCGGSSDVVTSECDFIEVWCKGSKSYVTMNCYAWYSSNTELLGGWPGKQTGVTGTYNSAEYAVWKFENVDNMSVIFNNGSDKQTGDITGLRKGYRYIYTLNDDWTVNPTVEKIDCSLPATNVLLSREAKVDVAQKTGVVFGYLKNNPNCDEITDYGFYFCTTADGAAACSPVENENLKWPASSTEILPRGKEFSANTGELFDGTTYYYRAYAVIGEETVLSQEVRSITTEPCKAQTAWGDPVIYTVDATFASDNVCKLYFRDVQKAIDHLKGSYVNDEEYQYVTNDNGSYNLNQPVVINVRYYDDTPNDPEKAYTYRGTTNVGCYSGDVKPTNSNLIQDFNKTATNRANTLTIKAGNKVAKPWVHHIVIRNSKNITLDSLCIYSDPTGLKDNALEIDVNSTDWPRISPNFTDANITIQNCMIGSAGFVGFQVSGYDGITFKGNDIEASFADNSNRLNILNWGASGKFLACKNIKFIQNNFRGSQPTLLWIQDSENALFMNNVFWNTNTFLKQNANEVTPCAIKLVSQYAVNLTDNVNIDNIGFFYNTFYFADNGTTGISSPYNFFTEYLAAANESNPDVARFGSNIYFQYNNCYSYDTDCIGKDAFLGKGSGDGTGVTYSIQSTSTNSANFCPNNFWSVKDAANATKSIFDFTTCNGSQIINVQKQVCETTASGPASLIVRGSDMNLGSAPDVSFTGIKLEADEVLADRYLVGVRPNGEGWTYGAYQTREAKDVKTIYWVGVTDSWDDRNNWEFEVKNNDKIVRQRVSCVENLSVDLHVVIEEIGTVEVVGGRKWPRLPESFDQEARFQESGIPVAEQVNAANTNKFADHIELEYGAGIIGVESLKNGELHYTKASNKFVSPRSEWILVGPTIKPFDEKTPSTDDVREVVSGDYFIKNHEPHVYMHKAKFLDDGISVGWDATFADLNTPLTANTVYAMQIPDQYGDFKLPAELYYTYVVPNAEKQKDAKESKEFAFEGRFYNEDALPTYTGLTSGQPVLISNTYPANIDANMLNTSGLGTVQIYDYEAKSFAPLLVKASTPILSQHGFVFTPAKSGDLKITSEYFLHTLTKRDAEVAAPYCRINVKNMKSNASSDIEVEFDDLKEDVANYATDAPKAFNSMEKSLPDMYVMRYDKKWAGVTVPSMTESIPLGIRISEAGTTIRFSYVDSEGLGDVILEDRLEGKTYNLTIGQLCEFSDLPVGDCEGRFFLNLSEEIEDEEDNTEEGGDVSTEVEEEFANSGISIIGNSNGVVVSCSTDMELQYIYINDMSGKTAMYKVSGNYVEISLPVAQGVYTVNVVADKANKTGKVILK